MLARKKCVPCEGGVPPLNAEQVEHYLKELDGWEVINNKLIKIFEFLGPQSALDFLCASGRIANEEDHHPVTEWNYRKVKVVLYTHAINGLSENDFILAAKFDELRKNQ